MVMSVSEFKTLLRASLNGDMDSLRQWHAREALSGDFVYEAKATASDIVKKPMSRVEEKTNAYVLSALIKCLGLTDMYDHLPGQEAKWKADIGIDDMVQAARLKQPSGIFAPTHPLAKALTNRLSKSDQEAKLGMEEVWTKIIYGEVLHQKDRYDAIQLLVSLPQKSALSKERRHVCEVLLAQCYQYGLGVDRDVLKADIYYKRLYPASGRQKQPIDDTLLLNPYAMEIASIECEYLGRLKKLEDDVDAFEKEAEKNPHMQVIAEASRAFHEGIKTAGDTLFRKIDITTDDIDQFKREFTRVIDVANTAIQDRRTNFWDKKVPEFAKWLLGGLSVLMLCIPALIVEKQAEHGFRGTFFYKKPDVTPIKTSLNQHGQDIPEHIASIPRSRR